MAKRIYYTNCSTMWDEKGKHKPDFCVADSVEEANQKFSEKYGKDAAAVGTSAITETDILDGYRISLEKIVDKTKE